MMHAKIITSGHSAQLETSINHFFELDEARKIISVQYNIDRWQENVVFSALIVYEGFETE